MKSAIITTAANAFLPGISILFLKQVTVHNSVLKRGQCQ